MKGKIFSRDEATRMLPLVRRITTDAKACSILIERHERSIVDLKAELNQEAAQDRPLLLGELKEHEDKLKVLFERRDTCSTELEDLGAFLVDSSEGIVRFYGDMDSRIVYFTWRLGEDEVSYWHETQEDFADRLPIGGDEKVANNAEV